MRNRLFAILVVFIFLGFYLSTYWPKAELQTPTEASQSQPVPPAHQTASVKKLETLEKSGTGPEKNRRPESHVEFRVVDGLAVAYGDIILGEPENKEVTEGWSEVRAPQLWDRAEIPYVINADLPHPERVEQVVRYFNTQTPVRFVPYTDQKDALVFQTGSEHCLSLLGRAGGLQPVKLNERCGRREILHEVMHALGFIHEQSRTDRNKYVEIKWDNIDKEFWPQFAVVPEALMAPVKDFPFDYQSIMLYKPQTFSKDKTSPTMGSKTHSPITPAEESLSEGDRKRLANLYP